MSRTMISMIGLKKYYRLYNKPVDRLKETFSIRRKKYGKEKYVLNNISLEIEEGEVIGIIGTNGSGKSTLLKIVTGILTPSEGKLYTNGKISALLELGAGFNPEYTGLKNIYLNGTMMGYTKEEMDKRVNSIIEFADIDEFIHQPVKSYSSGMFARLAFAVAINVEPDILIVDEALSVGDLRFQIKCMDKMKKMMDEGTTVLFVSHDINAIRRLCTRTLWLNDGRLEVIGRTNDVCDLYLDHLKLIDKEVSHEHEQTLPEIKTHENQPSVVEVVRVLIKNRDEETVDEFDIDELINVDVFYNVLDNNIETPVLGVAIKRIDDEYICGVNTSLDNVHIPWKNGENHFRLTYNLGMRVLGGKYYLDIGIFDKTATVPLCYYNHFKEFTVHANYIGEGICILPHHWSLGKA